VSRRWRREFRRANDVRLAELSKYFAGDPSYDEARRRAAEHEIDLLEEPEVRAMEARHRVEMEKLDAMLAKLQPVLEPLVRTDLVRVLQARVGSAHSGDARVGERSAVANVLVG
jgi:hypothetical protein